MSVRSYICIENDNKTYTGIYCHENGEPMNNGLTLALYYKNRDKVKELIDSGAIGKVCEVDFRLNRKFNREEALETWLYNTEISGGGKFYDIAPHSIDIMVYLFGNFVDIKGIVTNNNEEYKAVLDVIIQVREIASHTLKGNPRQVKRFLNRTFF